MMLECEISKLPLAILGAVVADHRRDGKPLLACIHATNRALIKYFPWQNLTPVPPEDKLELSEPDGPKDQLQLGQY
jgi:hypothetical protein